MQWSLLEDWQGVFRGGLLAYTFLSPDSNLPDHLKCKTREEYLTATVTQDSVDGEYIDPESVQHTFTIPYKVRDLGLENKLAAAIAKYNDIPLKHAQSDGSLKFFLKSPYQTLKFPSLEETLQITPRMKYKGSEII